MCYVKPGPQCSVHSLRLYLKAYAVFQTITTNPFATPQAILNATEDLNQAELQYDMTPRGQQQLKNLIVRMHDLAMPDEKVIPYEERLEEGRKSRENALASIDEEDMGDQTRYHQDCMSTMSLHNEQAPALAIPLEGDVGRVYRYPGSDPVPTGPNGGIILPSEEEAMANIRSGKWVPSITNIVDVRDKPHLINWASRRALKEAIEYERENPGYLLAKEEEAVQRFQGAGNRERDTSAEKGTGVHYACELIAQGREVPSNFLTYEQERSVQRYREWTAEFEPEIIGTEVTVFGSTPYGDYAGTADLLCKINGYTIALDIKTNRTGLHTDVAYQLSAICHAEHVSLDGGKSIQDMPKVDMAFGLHLSPRGYTFSMVEIDGEVWQTFQGERAMWEQHVFNGIQSDGIPVVLPGIRRRELVIPR